MRIIELHLHGFGKFQDFTLRLENGVNLVHGQNESGKSTLHSFINGMFYGFIKPYSKRILYSQDHQRFLPWSGSSYSGSIVFEKEGEIYRIYRVFSKGREETKVFHENTGEDITKMVQNANNSRVLQPGEYFFGVNSGVFNNTLFIGQQNIRPERSLAYEVRERLVNASTGGDEKISVEKALGYLDEQLKEIGTIRASTSEYGRLKTEIIDTEKKLALLMEKTKKYGQLMKSRASIEMELSHTEKELTNYHDMIHHLKMQEKLEIYEEVLKLRDKNKNLGEELESVIGHESKKQDDYEEAVGINEEIGLINSRIASWNEQIIEIEESVEKLYSEKTNFLEDHKELIEDCGRFQKLDFLAPKDESLEVLQNDWEKMKRYKALLIWTISLLSIIYMSLFIYSISQGNIVFLAFTQILLIPFVYCLTKVRAYRIELGKIEDIILIVYEKLQILKKHRMTDKDQLYNNFERAKLSGSKAEQEKELLKELQSKNDALSTKIRDSNIDSVSLHRELDKILKNNDSDSITQFKEGLKKKTRFRDIKREIAYNQETIQRTLKGEDIEELRRIYDSVREGFEAIESEDKDRLIQIHSSLQNRNNELQLKLKKVEGSLSQLEDAVEEEISLNEKLVGLKENENLLVSRRESLEFARDRIKKLSGEIHNDYATTLNSRVGGLLVTITDGKYSGVKVDKNLNVGLVEATSRRIIPVENLSGGTLDQLYFGLRIGIMEELLSQEFPLFLDECFSQYDDKRLENILGFIMKYEGRQVIMFTCHNREEKSLQEIGKQYNRVDLQQI
ncbi:ATP-binding protein [Gudongella sp. DL1XJH-153]|uniref:ATP-binding protein n=1 Tax=Gudongella sp. DL1XJH-153 TaxID=3409804 RepID=UPI003BB5E30A